MSLERIFKVLVSLDLSQVDAKVYMFLALLGPKNTLSIVNNLKISKQQISRSLRKLQERGIIFGDLCNQNEFSALPFEKALDLLIKTEKVKTQILQETRQPLLSDWKKTITEKEEEKD